MILPLHHRLRTYITQLLHTLYAPDADALPAVSLDYPPNRELGDLGTPLAFELARRLRKAPRVIAQEIASAFGSVPGVRRVTAAPNGYLNVHLERPAFLLERLAATAAPAPAPAGKAIVEHTAINPNKAAHIGHLRNAALGDTLVRVLRFRGVPVYTNTPTRTAQRGPGFNQIMCAVEPLIDRAARELGMDRVAIRLLNAPQSGSKFGARQGPVESCFIKEALTKGAARFKWNERKAQSGKRNGSKVTSVAVGQAYHPAGFFGFDGLVRITPDGKLHIHTGVGNLGTFSHSATARIAAEVLKCDWDNVILERGDSRRHLPWNIGQFGSNTSFTMSRTNYVAAMDAVAKLKEIACTLSVKHLTEEAHKPGAHSWPKDGKHRPQRLRERAARTADTPEQVA